MANVHLSLAHICAYADQCTASLNIRWVARLQASHMSLEVQRWKRHLYLSPSQKIFLVCFQNKLYKYLVVPLGLSESMVSVKCTEAVIVPKREKDAFGYIHR